MKIIDTSSLCGFRKREDDSPLEDSLTNIDTFKPEKDVEVVKDASDDDSLLNMLQDIGESSVGKLTLEDRDNEEACDSLINKLAEVATLEEETKHYQESIIELEEKENVIPFRPMAFEKPNPLPAAKKPTISQVKLQILAKQYVDSESAPNLDENKVVDLLDKLSKASKSNKRVSKIKRILKVVSFHSLSVVMFLAGVSSLLAVYVNHSSALEAKEGISLYKSGNLKQAYNQFEKSVAINPANATAHFYLGCLDEKSDEAKAYNHFKTALTYNPNNKIALDRAGALALKLDLNRDAVNDYNRLLRVSADDIRPYQLGNRAIAYTRLGEYTKALEDYQEVLELDPKNEAAIVGTAFCCMQKKELVAANTLLKNLLKRNPDNVEAHILNGWCLKNQKQYQKAEKHLTWVTKNAPENLRGHLYLAHLLSETGRNTASLKQLDKVLKVDPNNYEALAAKATCYLNLKQFKKAFAAYKELNNHPQVRETFHTLVNVAQAAAGAHENEIALDAFNKVIILRPEYVPPYMERAKILASKKMYNKAVEDMNTVIKLHNNYSPAYTARAKYHKLAGNNVSSVNDLHTALKHDPYSVEANLQLARYHMNLNKFASANDHFEKILLVEKDNKEALAGLAKSKKQLASLVGKKSFTDRTKLTSSEKNVLATNDSDKLVVTGYEAMQNGRLTFAAKAFTKAVKLSPNSKKARRYLYHTNIAMNMPRRAQVQLHALKALGEFKKNDNLILAKSFQRNGLSEQAIAILESHVKSFPTNVKGVIALSNAYAAVGDTDKALEICQNGLSKTRSNFESSKLKNLIASLKGSLERSKQVKQTNKKINLNQIDTRG